MLEFIGSALMFVVWIIVGVIALNVLLILVVFLIALISMLAEWICGLFRQ